MTRTPKSAPRGAKGIRVEDLIKFIEELGPDFNPAPAIDLLRKRAGDQRHVDHTIADMMEALWDEVQRLKALLDQSKGPKRLPKPRRKT